MNRIIPINYGVVRCCWFTLSLFARLFHALWLCFSLSMLKLIKISLFKTWAWKFRKRLDAVFLKFSHAAKYLMKIKFFIEKLKDKTCWRYWIFKILSKIKKITNFDENFVELFQKFSVTVWEALLTTVPVWFYGQTLTFFTFNLFPEQNVTKTFVRNENYF